MFKYYFDSSKHKVAVLSLYGVIDRQKRIEILNLLRRIESLNFSALLLDIDSPGGTVTDSELIYKEILRLKESRLLYVVACYGTIAASGALYISMVADKIFSLPSTITGSVGVIMKSIDLSQLYRMIGFKIHTVKSGKYKDILSNNRSMTPHEKKLLNEMITDSFEQFMNIIQDSRGLKREQIEMIANGEIYSGKKAYSLQMVDSIGSRKTAEEAIQQVLEERTSFYEMNLPRKESRFAFLKQLIKKHDLGGELQGTPLWLYEG